jgi:hypothetical protein
MHTPTHVAKLSDTAIDNVSVGGNHVYAVGSDHTVWEWGFWGRRCGEEKESAFEPEHADYLDGLWVHSVAAGSEHSLALCASLALKVDGFRFGGDKKGSGGGGGGGGGGGAGEAGSDVYALKAAFGLSTEDIATSPLRADLLCVREPLERRQRAVRAPSESR